MPGATVDIKVGYSCNNDCFHCVIADKRRDLLLKTGNADRSQEEIFQHIKDAGDENASTIVLTGGEVTIRRDFFEILEKALATVETVIIQTNGRMFYYEEFAKKISKYNRVHMTIAIHSADPEIHDWITGSKGSFKQTTEGIKNLTKYGVGNRIGAKLVISKKNAGTLSKIIKLCSDIGCKSINIAFPHAMGNARLNFYDCIPRYTEVKDEIIKTIKDSIELGIFVDFEAVPLCFLTNYETFASELRMAQHTILNDLTHKDADYTKSRQTTAKRKSPNCIKCKFNLICEGIWDDYEQGYDISELIPVPGEPIKDVRQLPSFEIHPVPIYERHIQTQISNKTEQVDPPKDTNNCKTC